MTPTAGPQRGAARTQAGQTQSPNLPGTGRTGHPATTGRHLQVTVLNWRDTGHPEGGGSERYIEQIAADLVADGCSVEILCSSHPQATGSVVRDGIQFRHHGGRWTVYARALGTLLLRRLRGRSPDVIIDVHNGIPFFARFVAGRPIVVLVHHVHREQWGVVFGRAMARLGWWLESWVSPRVHAGCQYVAVSEVTRNELIELGVRPDDIAVVHNGSRPVAEQDLQVRTAHPSLVVLGRLVPHKRVEHALQVLAQLRAQFPDLTLTVIGEGWWHPQLAAEAARLGVSDRVTFTGFVDEQEKEAILSRSWVMLAPSVKEGWGLMVVEAAAHGVPSIAYHGAGGLSESIQDGLTGLLVQDVDQLTEATGRLLSDHLHRSRLGEQARAHVARYSWRTASTSMHLVLRRAAEGLPPTSVCDPTASQPSAGHPLVIDLRETQEASDTVARAGGAA